jgi:hypothetical protein
VSSKEVSRTADQRTSYIEPSAVGWISQYVSRRAAARMEAADTITSDAALQLSLAGCSSLISLTKLRRRNDKAS